MTKKKINYEVELMFAMMQFASAGKLVQMCDDSSKAVTDAIWAAGEMLDALREDFRRKHLLLCDERNNALAVGNNNASD